jgi:thiamine biosynthesis lipoprotein
MQRIDFNAMHSAMSALIDHPSEAAARRLQRVPAWFEAWEQRFSRFRPDSELCQVNERGGRPPFSPGFAELLHEAQRASTYTQGLVQPTLLAPLQAAGYVRSWEEQVSGVMDSGVRKNKTHVFPEGPDSESLIPKTLTPKTCLFDFGGIAKGWAADKAVRRLAHSGPAMVNAGGDIAVSGPMADGSPWAIGVDDPLHPGEDLALLLLSSGGVATSGRDYRRWVKDGRPQHHIIDPRTGHPAVTDVLAATVIAPSARLAEAAAKAVLIQGSLSGLLWLEQRPELAGLVVLESGETLASTRWEEYLWSEA